MREFPFFVERVIDGDTVAGVADLGFHIAYRVRVRLCDVHAPELRGASSPLEREHAKQVAAFLSSLVLQRSVSLLSRRLDSFGRALGFLGVDDVVVNDAVNQFMVENGILRVRRVFIREG